MGAPGNLLTRRIVKWASQLRFPVLLLVVGTLFVVDLIAIDPIPLVDELILGLVAILLARWKDRRRVIEVHEANVVESGIEEQ